jgi:hypothetical protein
MAATITAEERDAIFAQILLAFYAFEDVDGAIESGDHELAYAVGRRVSDGLRLILDGGLGFAQRTAEPVTLKLPADELRPIMSRMRAQLDALHESRRPEFEASRAEEADVVAVRNACSSILDQL